MRSYGSVILSAAKNIVEYEYAGAHVEVHGFLGYEILRCAQNDVEEMVLIGEEG